MADFESIQLIDSDSNFESEVKSEVSINDSGSCEIFLNAFDSTDDESSLDDFSQTRTIYVIDCNAIYLPWVLFGFNFILRGGGFEEFLGILIGHLYYFLMYSYPLDYGGSQLIGTPQILYDYFPNRSAGGFGVPPAAARQPPPPQNNRRGHTWGQGRNMFD